MCEGRIGRERSAVRGCHLVLALDAHGVAERVATPGGRRRRLPPVRHLLLLQLLASVAISPSRRRRLSACSPILRSAAASCARHAASSLGGEGSSPVAVPRAPPGTRRARRCSGAAHCNGAAHCIAVLRAHGGRGGIVGCVLTRRPLRFPREAPAGWLVRSACGGLMAGFLCAVTRESGWTQQLSRLDLPRATHTRAPVRTKRRAAVDGVRFACARFNTASAALAG